MDKISKVLNYFTQGWVLVNKSLQVYILGVLLSATTPLSSLIPEGPLSTVIAILFSIINIFYVGFTLSTPVFFNIKQMNKPLTYQIMLQTAFRNTLRMILPGLLLILIFAVLVAALAMLFISTFGVQARQLLTIFGDLNGPFNPILISLMFIFHLFLFTPVLFSLENKGLLYSVKQSIVLVPQNLPFFIIAATLSTLLYSAAGLIPYSKSWGSFLIYTFNLYVSFVITAATLIYYQKVIKR